MQNTVPAGRPGDPHRGGGHGVPYAVACRDVGTLYLIRHGQASYGELDYDRLSPRGIEQALVVGRWAERAGLDALYAGPLRRQRETAQYAVEAAGGKLPVPQELVELAEYPAYEMLQHLVPKLVAQDAAFADLTTAP